MKKIIAFIIICISVISSANAQLSTAYVNRLNTVFDSVCSKYNIKGSSAALIVPGVGMWKGVHGESYAGQPITSDMIFGINSNTKTYVATTMLKLQEMGKVNLDDTIGTWIKGQKNINGQIKIRQLLNHTSGIFSFTEDPGFFDSVFTDFTRMWAPEEIYQFVDSPYFAPGTSWRYSNTNYLLAGIIIKQIMHQPFSKTLRDLVLTPQGLDSTIFFPEETSTLPTPHVWSVWNSGTYMEDFMALFSYENYSMFSASYTAGGIMATAADNAKFWNALLSRKILSDSSMKQMLQYTLLESSKFPPFEVDYGLGIFRYTNFFDGHTIFEHGGTNMGFINENAVDSNTGVTISVLTNQDSIDNDILLGNVIMALLNVSVSVSPTEVGQVASTSNIHIYPNPASDYVKVDIDNLTEPMTLQLYDISGKVITTKEINNNSTAIPTTQLQDGFYISRLIDKKGEVVNTQKIQIIK